MIFENDKVYDKLKAIFYYVCPAVLAFWSSLCLAWEIPYEGAITVTLDGLVAAYGIFLGISNYKYRAKTNRTEAGDYGSDNDK